MSWFSKFISKETSVPADASAEALSEEDVLIRELVIPRNDTLHVMMDPSGMPAFQSLMAMSRERQVDHLKVLTSWLVDADRVRKEIAAQSVHGVNLHLDHEWSKCWQVRSLLYTVMTRLLARKLPLTDDHLIAMLDWCLESENSYSMGSRYPVTTLVSLFEARASTERLPEPIVRRLSGLNDMISTQPSDVLLRRASERIGLILGSAPEIPLESGEAWSNAAIAHLLALPDAERAHWVELLLHCKAATGGSPTAKWLKQTTALLAKIDEGQFRSFVSQWFLLTDKKRSHPAITEHQWVQRCALRVFSERLFDFLLPNMDEVQRWRIVDKIDEAIRRAEDPWEYLRNFPQQEEARRLMGDLAPTFELPAEPPKYAPAEDLLIVPAHMELLVGLVWAAGLVHDTSITRALGVMAVSMYRKVPGKGPRAVRVGNACITALGMIGDEHALGQLALLKVKVKFGGAQAAIDKTMIKLAERLGVSREDLEEMSVPAYGMTDVGFLSLDLGGFTAMLTVVDSRSTVVSWIREDGKPQKSIPASIKQEFAEDLKEFMAAKKDIEKMLPAQAERLDGLYLRRKQWPFAVWSERYLNHPLVGSLARRLLWNFIHDGRTQAGVWSDGQLVDQDGNPIAIDESTTQVSLWHPLHQDAAVVQAWRAFLESRNIVQPFKQAHREIYLLTPAEEHTRVYSNRFAAHLLRQHQFNALCSARGWKNQLRLMVDSTYPPATCWLPEWDLRAEYWIEGAGSDYREDVLDSGAFRYVSTDQVRFYAINAAQVSAQAGTGEYRMERANATTPEPLNLADVDPLMFSEIMRDVDLFVGVASVGNDPNWLDGGRNDQRVNYWQSVSFGELNASAVTRKEILQKLIPKLKIANVCSFEDNFLGIVGKRHTYKIHLGSGNILISPQDKYLCIVPAQAQVDKAGERLFLPFEGDRVLSVILSKAFLLAADDKITDATILRQLE